MVEDVETAVKYAERIVAFVKPMLDKTDALSSGNVEPIYPAP